MRSWSGPLVVVDGGVASAAAAFALTRSGSDPIVVVAFDVFVVGAFDVFVVDAFADAFAAAVAFASAAAAVAVETLVGAFPL